MDVDVRALVMSPCSAGAGYVEDAILNINQRSGATSTADALEHVRKVVLEGPGSRLNDPDTATIVFVVTDGKCNNGLVANCPPHPSNQILQTIHGVVFPIKAMR